MSKKVFFGIILIVIIIGYLMYANGFFDSLKAKQSDNYLNIKDFSLNPDKYLDKRVVVHGKYSSSWVILSDYENDAVTLYDDGGFRIYFIPKVSRVFEEGKSYTITGTIKKVERHNMLVEE